MGMSDAQIDRLIGWLEVRFDGIDQRFDRLEARMDRLETRMDALEARMGGLEGRMGGLEGRMGSMHVEMLERFQSVNDRLDAMEHRVQTMSVGFDDVRGQLAATRADVEKIVHRLDRMDTTIYEQTMKLNSVPDEMRQRFRGVTDRLAGVEQRLAA